MGATRAWCVMNVEVCGESWQILGCLVGGRVEGYCGGKYGEQVEVCVDYKGSAGKCGRLFGEW